MLFVFQTKAYGLIGVDGHDIDAAIKVMNKLYPRAASYIYVGRVEKMIDNETYNKVLDNIKNRKK